jgi:hypothetical protein
MENNMEFDHLLNDTKKKKALSKLGFACIYYNLPDLHDLWNQAYPKLPMTYDQASTIFFEGVDGSEGYTFSSDADRAIVLEDLRQADLGKLADIVSGFLY